MLTLVAALFSYIYAKDALPEWRGVLSVAIILLSVSAVVGLSLGRIHRKAWDEYERTHAIWKTQFERVHIPAMAALKRHEDCVARVGAERARECAGHLIK
jgi:hypothetical protein